LCLFIAVGIFESFRLIIANSAGLISLKNTTFQFTLSPLEIQTFSKYTPIEPVMQLYNSRPEDTLAIKKTKQVSHTISWQQTLVVEEIINCLLNSIFL